MGLVVDSLLDGRSEIEGVYCNAMAMVRRMWEKTTSAKNPVTLAIHVPTGQDYAVGALASSIKHTN